MTISDAIPVQFWVNGVETYNQKAVCGINSVCFCQPFNCTDEIRIQFTDTAYSSYQLSILDEGGLELAELAFTEIAPDVFELSFVPNELGICNELVRLGIYNSTADLIYYEYFTLTIGNYANFGSGTTWLWTANNGGSAALSSFNAGDDSQYLRTPLAIVSGDVISISLNGLVNDDFGGFATLRVYLFNGATPTDTGLSVETIPLEAFSLTATYTSTGTYTHIGLYLDNADDLASQEFYVQQILISIDRDALATSDCIDIKTSHDCTALIRYDNAKDFAGIEYSDFSPTAEFYLRIPAVFFHERNTEEEENFELSSENMVRLRNEIKLKRLLEVGFMPDYMHRKLLLILAHDTVEIDGEEWIKRDPYEKEEPGNKRYPLKKASVLLTQKDYIKRNIL